MYHTIRLAVNRNCQFLCTLYLYIKYLASFLFYLCMLSTTLQHAHANKVKELSLSNVSQYLVDIEGSFDDLINGTERKIRWYSGTQQTKLALVYLHGFSASRQELSPVTELIADKLGANIYYARLKGHGRTEDAMIDGSVQAWLNDTRQAYEIGQLIGKQVIVISTSTGGTLATWLMAQPFANNIAANIMVSPNFGIKRKSAEIVRWPLGLKIAKWVNGSNYYSFKPLNDIHTKYWTERYPMEALVPVVKLVDQVNDLDKSTITTPQLIVYSPKDQVINTAKVTETAKQFSAAKVSLIEFTESLDPSQHVLAGDACSPESTDAMVKLVVDYLQQL